MTIVLRPATEADAPAIGEFQTRCWNDAYRGLVPDAYLDSTTVEERTSRWRARIVEGRRRVVLAFCDDELAGVASTCPRQASRPDLPGIELASLYVDGALHGTGLAQQLLAEAIGTGPAHLWAFVGNRRAERFYEKAGFRPSDEVQLDPDTGVHERRWVRAARA